MYFESLACAGVLFYAPSDLAFLSVHSSVLGYEECLPTLGECREVFGNDSHVYNVESLANQRYEYLHGPLRSFRFHQYVVLL
jgi:hypothetical protein